MFRPSHSRDARKFTPVSNDLMAGINVLKVITCTGTCAKVQWYVWKQNNKLLCTRIRSHFAINTDKEQKRPLESWFSSPRRGNLLHPSLLKVSSHSPKVVWRPNQLAGGFLQAKSHHQVRWCAPHSDSKTPGTRLAGCVVRTAQQSGDFEGRVVWTRPLNTAEKHSHPLDLSLVMEMTRSC